MYGEDHILIVSKERSLTSLYAKRSQMSYYISYLVVSIFVNIKYYTNKSFTAQQSLNCFILCIEYHNYSNLQFKYKFLVENKSWNNNINSTFAEFSFDHTPVFFFLCDLIFNIQGAYGKSILYMKRVREDGNIQFDQKQIML